MMKTNIFSNKLTNKIKHLFKNKMIPKINKMIKKFINKTKMLNQLKIFKRTIKLCKNLILIMIFLNKIIKIFIRMNFNLLIKVFKMI
jgi:hypothetical protein